MRTFITLLSLAFLAASTCFSQPGVASSTSGVNRPADWRDRSGDLPGTETDIGLLIAGCAVAGGGIITSLLIPSPTPELFIPDGEIRSQEDRLVGFKKPVKISLNDAPAYGLVQSLDSTTLRLKTRDEEVLIQRDDIDYIMDLSSAAGKSRTSKTKSAVMLGGAGVGVCLIAASQKNTGVSSTSVEDASSLANTLLYAAGGCLIVGGLWAILSHSDDERELQAWEGQNSPEPSHSSSFFNDVQMNVAVMPVRRVHSSAGCVAESIPCVQARIGLHF